MGSNRSTMVRMGGEIGKSNPERKIPQECVGNEERVTE